jgi:hypothetical protein
MNPAATVTQKELSDYLLNVAVAADRPVFIWGQPGVGKSSLVEQFAESLGLTCVSLLGSQLAPEDIIGVPQIIDGKSRFCPPVQIARDEPYCLFLDELNACSHEVQKAFYSLIHDRRIGDYYLPKGSIVIGAGNRAQDSAIVKPLSSALINRLVHVHLKVSHRDWLEWAAGAGVHHLVMDYIQTRPDHLWSPPPRHEEPFSTPRSWHMLSDTLKAHNGDLKSERVKTLALGCLTPDHAVQFAAYVKQIDSKYQLKAIINGEIGWPSDPKDRDILYFLTQGFRAQMAKELPREQIPGRNSHKDFSYKAKLRLKELAEIGYEFARMAVYSEDKKEGLPNWFMVEVVRDLPRMVEKANGK